MIKVQQFHLTATTKKKVWPVMWPAMWPYSERGWRVFHITPLYLSQPRRGGNHLVCTVICLLLANPFINLMNITKVCCRCKHNLIRPVQDLFSILAIEAGFGSWILPPRFVSYFHGHKINRLQTCKNIASLHKSLLKAATLCSLESSEAMTRMGRSCGDAD